MNVNRNRFDRLAREAHEAIGLVEDEYLELVRVCENIIAQNKRLKFANCPAPSMGRQATAFQAMERSQRLLPTKVDTYFNVWKWKWVAEAVIPYRLGQPGG